VLRAPPRGCRRSLSVPAFWFLACFAAKLRLAGGAAFLGFRELIVGLQICQSSCNVIAVRGIRSLKFSSYNYAASLSFIGQALLY
jgi:hypothetical protein